MSGIEQHQPSSLQKLVEEYGTYDKITPEAWKRFDEQMALWKARLHLGGFRDPTIE